MSDMAAPTALRSLHATLGGRMVAFAGYELPLHYRSGVLEEHLQTRRGAGLFDVSHMGQIVLTGDRQAAAQALETMLPIDVIDLAPGRQRYGLLLDETGEVIDDLMVSNFGDQIVLVVNAANKHEDLASIRNRLPSDVTAELASHALLALQGPSAARSLAQLLSAACEMSFMDVRRASILGVSCTLSRSGYTGEDGFEISVPAERAIEIADALLSSGDVLPVGLGARDSLRLEAGLCLYGSDLDRTTTPVQAGLAWAISSARRRGGRREGGFPAADRILTEIAEGPSRRRVGLRGDGRMPVRAGAHLFEDEHASDAVGRVTSGCFSPSLRTPVAMGYVPARLGEPGRRLFAEVRGQRVAMTICRLPFVPSRVRRPAFTRSATC